MAAPDPEVGNRRPRVNRPSGAGVSGSLVGVDTLAVTGVVVTGTRAVAVAAIVAIVAGDQPEGEGHTNDDHGASRRGHAADPTGGR